MATGSAADKRLFLARLAEARDSSEGGPRKRLLGRTAAALVGVTVLALLGVWMSGFFSTPKELLEIRTVVDKQIDQLQKVARNEAPLTYNDTGFRQVWERMRNMSPEVREQAREEMERLLRAREQAEQRSYFAMPPQERQKELDRRIKAEQARRQELKQQRANRNRGNGGNGGPGQAAAAAGGQGSQDKKALLGRGGANGGAAQANAAGAPAARVGASGGGQGGGRPAATRGGSDEARTARSKRRIDSTDPDERAQNAEYRRQMDLRRQQLGISPGRGRGG